MTAGDGQIRCDGCGSELNPEAKFCRSCGRSTSAAVDSPSPGGAAAPTPASSQGVESSPAAETTTTHCGWNLVSERSEPFTKPCSLDTTSIESAEPLFQPEKRKMGRCGRHIRRWPSSLELSFFYIRSLLQRMQPFPILHDSSTTSVSATSLPRTTTSTTPHHRPRPQPLSNPPMWRQRRSIPPCSELKRPQCNRRRDQ